MDSFSFEILSLLKKKFIGSQAYQFQVDGNSRNLSPRQFYLKNLNDNLFGCMNDSVKAQYQEGSGNELEDKMKAIRSSSAMTYNIFGNTGTISICGDKNLGKGKYTVEFEKKLHTLNSNSNGRPANLDAFLYCDYKKEAIACEMKMTEWLFDKPGKLRNAYLNPANYDDENAALVFIKAAKSLIDTQNSHTPGFPTREKYAGKLHRYDAFQMFKHTLACYNECKRPSTSIKKLTLINCVWEIPCSLELTETTKEKYEMAVKEEHDQYQLFYSAMQPLKAVFQSINVDFDICYYSVMDFVNILEISKTHKEYLKRYTF